MKMVNWSIYGHLSLYSTLNQNLLLVQNGNSIHSSQLINIQNLSIEYNFKDPKKKFQHIPV